MASAATLLAAIDTAIETIVTGTAASYAMGSRTYTSLNIGELFDIRDRLQAQVDREAGGGLFRLAKFQRTSQ